MGQFKVSVKEIRSIPISQYIHNFIKCKFPLTKSHMTLQM